MPTTPEDPTRGTPSAIFVMNRKIQATVSRGWYGGWRLPSLWKQAEQVAATITVRADRTGQSPAVVVIQLTRSEDDPQDPGRVMTIFLPFAEAQRLQVSLQNMLSCSIFNAAGTAPGHTP